MASTTPALYQNPQRRIATYARASPSAAVALKRRKVRRGTSSCWECRHRKVRCNFVANNTICVPCQRRGSECIGQEFQTDSAGTAGHHNAAYREVSRSLQHVEGLVNQLLSQAVNGPSTVAESAPLLPSHTPESRRGDPVDAACSIQRQQHRVLRPRPIEEGQSTSSDSVSVTRQLGEAVFASSRGHVRVLDQRQAEPRGRAETEESESEPTLSPAMGYYYPISHHLHSLMPPLGSALAILRRAKFADLPVQMIQRPYGQFLESSVARQPGATFDVPERTAHPVLIARSLLQIALSLQLLSNTGSARSLQSAKGASHRYFEAATQYVTSQDLLLGSYDGLETLMLEGLYQINEGNLRQGWLAFRRAIGIAQVMKVPIQSQKEEEDDESEPDPSINQVLTKSQFLWFRLNYSDRFLSLMLGLPFAAADDSFVSSRVMAADVPVGRLERMHTIIMGRLISRNQRMSAAHHITQALQSELEETDSIDQELQRVLRQFPGHWWLSPHLCDLTTGAIDSLEETSRLLAQVNQANLLLLLHLPYAIQGFSSSPQLDYAYNMHNTIKASRDVLSRFVLYRKFNQVPSCCRAVDSKALTASASLVLAHLDGHRLGRANVLMHQRLEDLGLVQMAIKSIEGLVALSPKSQGEIEARVLKGLLDTEARAADGVLHTIHFDEWGSGGECYVFEEGETLDFRAPYLGRVRIEPLEVRPNPRAAAPGGPLDRQFGIATSTSSSEEIEAWPSLQSVAPGNAVASLAGLFPGMGPLTGEVDIHVPETTWVSAASFTATELNEGGVPYLSAGAGYMSAPGLGGIWLDDRGS